ncbi:CheR family methyltransferase [Chondromyces crocatus]|uniref:CheR-type methyltransferase domain-containing protein n=1 Tax=Chondromyces crocatus TaxID=52 RepID=A0A0K1ESA1_CHOCO|nr:CheR family methyltransferase [Chondromyces crocatus]AKT43669.1 uncharacterized protein CMC5_079040 [Chondromyces crocatus]
MAEEEMLEQIRELIEARFGLACTDWQQALLTRAVERWQKAGVTPGATPHSSASSEQVQALVAELLVRETYFFRDKAQIDALIEVALPACARLGTPGRPLRLLSAGCASGEEPYSLALAIGERAGHLADRTWIHGFDLSRVAVEHAREGLYDSWALRATPEGVRARAFRAEGNGFRLKDEHRARVTFEQRNLLDPDPEFWRPGSFDVIFCRNVTLYFSERAIRAALARFAAALVPGGFLFLGASETLRGLSDDFELSFWGDTAIHRRREQPEGDAFATSLHAPSCWMEQIHSSTARIVALTARDALEEEGEPPCPPPSARSLRRLVETERFGEGLALIRRAAASHGRRSELQLFEAIMLSGLGRIEELERVCAKLNATQGAHAGSYYLLGLCREHANDRSGAIGFYREALRADPSFAMAHLRLGLLWRTVGDLRGARTALREALAGLSRGPEEHVVLFGGGFTRATLETLCREQLVAAEIYR